MAAHPDPVGELRDPDHCFDVVRRIVEYLRREQRITLIEQPMTAFAHFDRHTRTFYLRAGLGLREQAWAVFRLWMLLVLGPDSTPEARPEYRPHLSVVPDPPHL